MRERERERERHCFSSGHFLLSAAGFSCSICFGARFSLMAMIIIHSLSNHAIASSSRPMAAMAFLSVLSRRSSLKSPPQRSSFFCFLWQNLSARCWLFCARALFLFITLSVRVFLFFPVSGSPKADLFLLFFFFFFLLWFRILLCSSSAKKVMWADSVSFSVSYDRRSTR